MKKSVYIVEDNQFVREAIRMLIRGEPDLEVCGFAETAADALDAIPGLSPDLVLTDFSLPGMNGIELIKRLRVLKPQQRVAMLSGHSESAYAARALAAGAGGYVLKGDPVAMLECIRQVLSGEE